MTEEDLLRAPEPIKEYLRPDKLPRVDEFSAINRAMPTEPKDPPAPSINSLIKSAQETRSVVIEAYLQLYEAVYAMMGPQTAGKHLVDNAKSEVRVAEGPVAQQPKLSELGQIIISTEVIAQDCVRLAQQVRGLV